jgi:hypothetical protein
VAVDAVVGVVDDDFQGVDAGDERPGQLRIQGRSPLAAVVLEVLRHLGTARGEDERALARPQAAIGPDVHPIEEDHRPVVGAEVDQPQGLT